MLGLNVRIPGESKKIRGRRRVLLLEPLESRWLLSGVGNSTGLQLFDASPALFVENQGQVADAAVRYAFYGAGTNVLFTDAGPVFQVFQESADTADARDPIGNPLPSTGSTGTVRAEQFAVRFEGANRVTPSGLDLAPTVYNYCLGDAAQWRTGVAAYQKLAYAGLYAGIDLQTGGRRDGLKYEFHVAPGADFSQIRVHYEGIEGLTIDAQGALHVQTALGELVDDAPFIYQSIDGRQQAVAGRFQLLDADTYTFSIDGAYDPQRELVIDPTLSWSSYLGGSSNDYGNGITFDPSGNILVTGQTESTNFEGANNVFFGSTSDAFVAKLTSSGTLSWMTYFGGTGVDYAYGVAADSYGNALISGQTSSSDLAGKNNTFHGSTFFRDAFVAKFTPLGWLSWSTFLGGVSPDQGDEIVVNTAGDALIVGTTGSGDFAGVNNVHHGDTDAFVAKVSGSGATLWATFLGGSNTDVGQSLALDSFGNILATGYTMSNDFAGANNTAYGLYDAFVAKVSSAGVQTWAHYLGGSGYDGAYGIGVDSAGDAFVAGSTNTYLFSGGSTNSNHGGESDAFVSKVRGTSGSPYWTTYLGGSDADTGSDVALDSFGNAVVVGGTSSTDFAGAQNGNYGTINTQDGFAARVTSGGAQTWALYVGGSSGDGVVNVAVEGSVRVALTGSTDSTDFVNVNNTYHYGGTGIDDAFVALIPLTLAVTVNQAAGQADPAIGGFIHFTVNFTAPVTDFTSSDVTLGGTAPGTLVAGVTGSGATYDVMVQGMTGNGTVIAGIAAGRAHDSSGNPNLASTSTDNVVTYLTQALHPTACGIYDPVTSRFYLKYTNSEGMADVTFGYGAPGWKPLAGDWNGDGTDTIGLFQPEAAHFYLRNSNDSGPADLSFGYGDASQGDQYVLVMGDWNNDGVDTIGLYHKASAAWFLRNTNSEGMADLTFGFGAPGSNWVPLVGDWNGDGTDTIGLYDPATGMFYLRNSHTTGMADIAFPFGAIGSGWTPLIGDWDGDGGESAGFYQSGAASHFYLRNSFSPGPADMHFGFGFAGVQPIVGNWLGLGSQPASQAAHASPSASALATGVEGVLDAHAVDGVFAAGLLT